MPGMADTPAESVALIYEPRARLTIKSPANNDFVNTMVGEDEECSLAGHKTFDDSFKSNALAGQICNGHILTGAV